MCDDIWKFIEYAALCYEYFTLARERAFWLTHHHPSKENEIQNS